jgi:hypothetical protein
MLDHAQEIKKHFAAADFRIGALVSPSPIIPLGLPSNWSSALAD